MDCERQTILRFRSVKRSSRLACKLASKENFGGRSSVVIPSERNTSREMMEPSTPPKTNNSTGAISLTPTISLEGACLSPTVSSDRGRRRSGCVESNDVSDDDYGCSPTKRPASSRLKSTLLSSNDMASKLPCSSEPRPPKSLQDADSRCSSRRKRLDFGTPRKVTNGVQSGGSTPILKALSQSIPDTLICRDRELNTLKSILESSFGKNRALYISGPPGTGKTASVMHTMKHLQNSKRFRSIYVNCMSVSCPASLYRIIAESLDSSIARRGLSLEKIQHELEMKMLVSGKVKIAIVLDEIDAIQTKSQAVLNQVFQWPFLSGSCVSIVIGISNLLDLTDRSLPFHGPKIERMHFKPYSASQITAILKHRLLEASDIELDSAAVELCARKVSAITGDVRKALDICRVAVIDRKIIDYSIDSPKGKSPPGRTSCLSSGSMSKQRPQVGTGQVLRAANKVYGTKIPSNLPLQQKLILASMLKLTRSSGSTSGSPVTLSRLFLTYRSSCAAGQVSACGQSECLNLCQLLETEGLLSVAFCKKDVSASKVELLLDEATIKQALKDQALLSLAFNY